LAEHSACSGKDPRTTAAAAAQSADYRLRGGNMSADLVAETAAADYSDLIKKPRRMLADATLLAFLLIAQAPAIGAHRCLLGIYSGEFIMVWCRGSERRPDNYDPIDIWWRSGR
jgi:hypothetical protein